MADNNVWVNITDLLWPVGSFYITYSNDPDDSPVNLFGGTWKGPVTGSTYTIDGISYVEYKYVRTATGTETNTTTGGAAES